MNTTLPYDVSGRRSHTYGNTGPGRTLVLVAITEITISSVLLSNRLYWRWKKRVPGVDDILIIIAWVFLLALGIISYEAVDLGYGRKMSSLTRTEASGAMKFFFVYQIVYKLSVNTSKLSILSLYLRVFGTSGWFGRLTQCLIVIVAGYMVSATMANIFNCSPISTNWNPDHGLATAANRGGRCINTLAFWYTSALYNIASEVVMLLAVLVRIWTLPSQAHPPVLQFRQKINLTIVLGLGVFTATTAILRMTTLSRTAAASDRTAGTLTSTIWSSIEAGLGVTIANLPMLRQLLRWRGWCGGRWFGSTASRSTHSRRKSSHGMQHEPRGRTGSVCLNQIRRQQDFERRIVMSDTDISFDLEAQDSNQSLSRSGTTKSEKTHTGMRESTSAPSFSSTTTPTAPLSLVVTSTELDIKNSNNHRNSDIIQPVPAARFQSTRS